MTAAPNRVRIALRGTLIALAVAAVIGAVVFAAVMLISGKPEDALRAAGYMALGYLALNLIVLGIGLVARPPDIWAVGAALATPVILAAIGFGYTIFLAKPI
ncbi:MAG TPA: hypothetical protein VM284_03965 [Candidatus Limnocylindria bacterium]|nr:hypothetical protein [Candidatus Limnocylindria bacterium]